MRSTPGLPFGTLSPLLGVDEPLEKEPRIPVLHFLSSPNRDAARPCCTLTIETDPRTPEVVVGWATHSRSTMGGYCAKLSVNIKYAAYVADVVITFVI